MDDPIRGFLDEIVRSVVPKSWEVVVRQHRNSIGIDNHSQKIGWGLSWSLDDQNLKVACGTSSITVNLADPKSKEELDQFFRWLTDWTYKRSSRTQPPKGLVIEHTNNEGNED